MTDICERLVRFKDKVCISSDLEVEAADTIEALRTQNVVILEFMETQRKIIREKDDTIEALRAENAKLKEALNGLVVAVDWEATAIIGGADDVVIRAQILQACARAAVGESDEAVSDAESA